MDHRKSRENKRIRLLGEKFLFLLAISGSGILISPFPY